MDGVGRNGWVVSVDILIIILPPGTTPTVKPEGVVSFCSSAARFFRFRAMELGILMPLTEEVVAQPVGIRTVPSRFRLNTR